MESIHLWRIFVGVMLVLAIVNVVFIDYVWLSERTRVNEAVEKLNQLTVAVKSLGQKQLTTDNGQLTEASGSAEPGCGQECRLEVKKQVDIAMTQLADSASVGSGGSSSVAAVAPAASKAGTYYIPLSGTGSTKGLDWANLTNTETEIDWKEYGGNRTVSWDVYAKVFQGNGKVLVRLFDKTNGVAVTESELSTSSENTVHLVSGNLSLWSGKNTYVVQVKSLTGYEAFFESGRIKVVVK